MSINIGRVEIGTVSHGTLRPQDLAPAFANYALYIGVDLPGELVDAAEAVYNETYDGDAAEVLIELGDLIDDALPSFLYFGTHEGDGSDWGVFGVDGYSEELIEALLRVYQTEYSDYTQHIDALKDALNAALGQIAWH